MADQGSKDDKIPESETDLFENEATAETADQDGLYDHLQQDFDALLSENSSTESKDDLEPIKLSEEDEDFFSHLDEQLSNQNDESAHELPAFDTTDIESVAETKKIDDMPEKPVLDKAATTRTDTLEDSLLNEDDSFSHLDEQPSSQSDDDAEHELPAFADADFEAVAEAEKPDTVPEEAPSLDEAAATRTNTLEDSLLNDEDDDFFSHLNEEPEALPVDGPTDDHLADDPVDANSTKKILLSESDLSEENDVKEVEEWRPMVDPGADPMHGADPFANDMGGNSPFETEPPVHADVSGDHNIKRKGGGMLIASIAGIVLLAVGGFYWLVTGPEEQTAHIASGKQDQPQLAQMTDEQLESVDVAAMSTAQKKQAMQELQAEISSLKKKDAAQSPAETVDTKQAALEKANAQRAAAEKTKAEQLAARQAVAAKAKTDHLIAQKEAAQKATAQKAAAEKLKAEQLAARKAAAQQAAKQRAAAKAKADRLMAQKEAARKAAVEKAAAQRAAAEKLKAEQVAARKAAAKQAAKQRAVAEKAKAEQLAARQAVAAKAKADQLIAQKAAARKAAAEKVAASTIAVIKPTTPLQKQSAKAVQRAAPVVDEAGNWVIYLASVNSNKSAIQHVARFQAMGVKSEAVRVKDKGRIFHRIRMSGFTSKLAAKKQSDVMAKKLGLRGARIEKL